MQQQKGEEKEQLRVAKQYNETLLIIENKKTNKKKNKDLYKDYSNHVSFRGQKNRKSKNQRPTTCSSKREKFPEWAQRERKMKQAAVGLHRPCMYALVGLGLYL